MNFPSSLTLLIDVNFLSTKIGSFFTPLTVIMFPFATLTKKTSAWIVVSSAPSIASVLVAADAAITVILNVCDVNNIATAKTIDNKDLYIFFIFIFLPPK